MDPDMVLGSGPSPDATMVLGGSAGYLDWHGCQGSMALGHQCGHRFALDLGIYVALSCTMVQGHQNRPQL